MGVRVCAAQPGEQRQGAGDIADRTEQDDQDALGSERGRKRGYGERHEADSSQRRASDEFVVVDRFTMVQPFFLLLGSLSRTASLFCQVCSLMLSAKC